MIDVPELQAYLRASARRQYEAVPIPPFTLFFHPTDALPYFNYAIPDHAVAGDINGPLSELRDMFARRARQPRFEFLHEFAPDLGDILLMNGFHQQARQQCMICTPSTHCPVSPVPGLQVVMLDRHASITVAETLCVVQRRGFDPDSPSSPTPEEAAQFLRGLGDGRAFLAYLDGKPVGAGMFTAPIAGIAELCGIATLVSYRRRGIATALTAYAVQSAFDLGVHTLCLTAEDRPAGRVYERVGFVPYATALAFSVVGE